jgi:hypothetical protein
MMANRVMAEYLRQISAAIHGEVDMSLDQLLELFDLREVSPRRLGSSVPRLSPSLAS